MAKIQWKPGNMVYPLPAVMVSCADKEGNSNIITVAWTGTVCTNPPMAYISVRPERHSYKMIRETGEFVINLTNRKLTKVTDFVGVRSGRDIDKFNLEGDLKITKQPSKVVKAPCIAESPVCLECKVRQIVRLGSHDMFIGEVVSTDVDESLLDENGRLDLQRADLIAYSHGEYYGLGKKIGKFGYSVQKKKPVKKAASKKKTKKK